MKTHARPTNAVAPAPSTEHQRRVEPQVPDLSHLATRPVTPEAETAGSAPPHLLHDSAKATFLGSLRSAVTQAVKTELAGTDWTAEQCPYLEYWFAYYEARGAGEVERALFKYAPSAAGATTLDGYIEPAVARVRTAVARWRATGEVDAPASDLPEVQSQLAELGPGEPLDSATRTRFEGAMGIDLSRTRIHRDARGAMASAEEGAHAIAIGNHVAFNAGQYAPGTTRGDALLAHELAHTRQQDSSKTASGPSTLERGADQAATSWLGRLWGLVTTPARAVAPVAGLHLQRCRNDAAAELSQLGREDTGASAESDVVTFKTDPPMQRRNGEWFAVVGQKIKLEMQVPDPTRFASIATMFASKLGDQNKTTTRQYSQAHEVELDSAGTWVVWAGGHRDGHRDEGFSTYRRVTVEEPAAYAEEAAKSQAGPNSDLGGATAYLRLRLALADRLESQFGALATQYSAGPYIKTDGPNPVGTKDRTFTYRVQNVPAGAASFRWTRSNKGAPIYSDPGNQHLWTELGTSTLPELQVSNHSYSPGIYDYTCEILDATGHQMATARYRQSVLSDDRMDVAKEWLAYLGDAETQFKQLKSPLRLPGAFVNGSTGEAMPLNVFVGESATKPGTWRVLDLTPDASKGKSPEVHDFSGSTIDQAIDQFRSDAQERYPRGRLHLMTSLLPGHTSDLAFAGGKKSWLRSLADWLGLASIGWTVAGFTAALFGAEPLAMLFFSAAAGTGAAASAVSIADRVKTGDADVLGYFVDVAGFAVSVIGAGQAYSGYQRALAAAKGASAAEVATSLAGRRFVQWTETKLVQSTAIVITVESIAQIEQIASDPRLGDEEKVERIAGLLKQITLQVGILSVSKSHPLPAALQQRARALGAVERSALNILDEGALETVAKMPDPDLKEVVALALDHPSEVNAALKSGTVNSVAELEAAVKPAAAPVIAPELAVEAPAPPAPAPKTQQPAAPPPTAPDVKPSPALAPHVSGMTKEEFVAAYKKRNRRTSYSDAQLETMYDEGNYIINKQSGLLNDVNAGKYGPPSVRADYVRDGAGVPIRETKPRDTLPADFETNAKHGADQRRTSLNTAKEARDAAAVTIENEAQEVTDARVAAAVKTENEAMQQARLASKELGEDAAELFGKKFETDGRKMTKGKGAGDFDFSYTGGSTDEAIVLEAKGGESGLGSRFGLNGITRVEQGTDAYARAVIRDIEKRDEPRARQLVKARKAGKLRYFLVRQGFTNTGELGVIEIMEFKL